MDLKSMKINNKGTHQLIHLETGESKQTHSSLTEVQEIPPYQQQLNLQYDHQHGNNASQDLNQTSTQKLDELARKFKKIESGHNIASNPPNEKKISTIEPILEKTIKKINFNQI